MALTARWIVSLLGVASLAAAATAFAIYLATLPPPNYSLPATATCLRTEGHALHIFRRSGDFPTIEVGGHPPYYYGGLWMKFAANHSEAQHSIDPSNPEYIRRNIVYDRQLTEPIADCLRS
jgi:hypothetical protein